MIKSLWFGGAEMPGIYTPGLLYRGSKKGQQPEVLSAKGGEGQGERRAERRGVPTGKCCRFTFIALRTSASCPSVSFVYEVIKHMG